MVAIKGVRRDRTDNSIFQPGEYGKAKDGNFYGCAPGLPNMGCNLTSHKIVEHEDGTITVSPSILISSGRKGVDKWHGYLEKGVWREC